MDTVIHIKAECETIIIEHPLAIDHLKMICNSINHFLAFVIENDCPVMQEMPARIKLPEKQVIEAEKSKNKFLQTYTISQPEEELSI